MQLKKSVIIIEEDRFAREVYKIALDLVGLNSKEANVGEALRLLKEGQERPDCILLNLNTSEVRGDECIKSLAQRYPLFEGLPVVFCSRGNPDNEISSSEYLLEKPFELGFLTRLVSKFSLTANHLE